MGIVGSRRKSQATSASAAPVRIILYYVWSYRNAGLLKVTLIALVV